MEFLSCPLQGKVACNKESTLTLNPKPGTLNPNPKRMSLNGEEDSEICMHIDEPDSGLLQFPACHHGNPKRHLSGPGTVPSVGVYLGVFGYLRIRRFLVLSFLGSGFRIG